MPKMLKIGDFLESEDKTLSFDKVLFNSSVVQFTLTNKETGESFPI